MRRIEPSSLTSLHYLATAVLLWLLAAYFLIRLLGLFADEFPGTPEIGIGGTLNLHGLWPGLIRG